MTRIDRYLLVMYLRVFLICFMTIAGLMIVVQVFTNLDEFIQYGRDRGNFVGALTEYFSPHLLSIFDRMCGLLTLLSTMFVVAWLYRTHEMTALLAAGISKGRVIKPILVASLLSIVVAAISREVLIPHYATALTRNPQDLAGEHIQSIRPTEDFEQGILIAGRSLKPANREILQPIFKFSSPVTQLTRQITGRSARFLDADPDHPQGYLVIDAQGAEEIAGKSSIQTNDGNFLYLPTDTPWLKPNECFVPSKLEYDMLRGGSSKQFASTADLIWRLRYQSRYYGSDLKVAVHARLVQPLLDLTQLLLGIPMILTNRNRNLVSMIISCCLSFAAFFGVSIGLNTMGANGTLITPATAAWAPLLIFGPIAWIQSKRAMQS